MDLLWQEIKFHQVVCICSVCARVCISNLSRWVLKPYGDSKIQNRIAMALLKKVETFFENLSIKICFKDVTKLQQVGNFLEYKNTHIEERKKEKNKTVKSRLCLTLCNPMDCSLPGSSVHEIFQAEILEWVAISFSSKAVNNRLFLVY